MLTDQSRFIGRINQNAVRQINETHRDQYFIITVSRSVNIDVLLVKFDCPLAIIKEYVKRFLRIADFPGKNDIRYSELVERV